MYPVYQSISPRHFDSYLCLSAYLTECLESAHLNLFPIDKNGQKIIFSPPLYTHSFWIVCPTNFSPLFLSLSLSLSLSFNYLPSHLPPTTYQPPFFRLDIFNVIKTYPLFLVFFLTSMAIKITLFSFFFLLSLSLSLSLYLSIYLSIYFTHTHTHFLSRSIFLSLSSSSLLWVH